MNGSLARRIRWRLAAVCAAFVLGAAGAGAALYYRLHAYDGLIADTARRHAIDPAIIRAVIWRESRFSPRRVGRRGEIGLMQVTETAAREWAAATRRPAFATRDLFDPAVNLEAGTWYLRRALAFWEAKVNPLPYALAEYNAGRSNALRWAADDRNDPNVFWEAITYPATRSYVRAILGRVRR